MFRHDIDWKPAAGLINVCRWQHRRHTGDYGIGREKGVGHVSVISWRVRNPNARWFNTTHSSRPHHLRRYVLARGQTNVKGVGGDRDNATKAPDVMLGITTGGPR